MQMRFVVPTVVAVILGSVLFGPTLATAQDAPSSITVIGYGQASAPADRATLRMAISETSYGPPTAPAPGAQEREAVAPVVASLTEAGLANDNIEVIVGPYVRESYGAGGPAIALIRVDLNDPDPQRIIELVDAASVGAAEERLIVNGIGVSYDVDDCAALQREAREQAIADARQHAELQAELLDVTVGDLLASRDMPSSADAAFDYYGPLAGYGCTPVELPDASLAQYGATTFDPTSEAEVVVYAQVELTFSVSASAASTPAS